MTEQELAQAPEKVKEQLAKEGCFLVCNICIRRWQCKGRYIDWMQENILNGKFEGNDNYKRLAETLAGYVEVEDEAQP